MSRNWLRTFADFCRRHRRIHICKILARANLAGRAACDTFGYKPENRRSIRHWLSHLRTLSHTSRLRSLKAPFRSISYYPRRDDHLAIRAAGRPTSKACPIRLFKSDPNGGQLGKAPIAESGTTTYCITKCAATPNAMPDKTACRIKIGKARLSRKYAAAIEKATVKCIKMPINAVFTPPERAASRPRIPDAGPCQTSRKPIPK